MELTKWTKPLHYKGKLEIGKGLERKLYGPNLMDEMYWPVNSIYDADRDMTTVDFAMVVKG